jgi:arylsulfatase A
MKRLSTILVAAAMLGSVALTLAAGTPQKPNIIFILADDLGINGVSCYGADTYQTPNIDRLAQGGLRFTHCYSTPLCGPSRCLLMTGRYAFRTGMTGNDSGPLIKPDKEIMMPRVLKAAGYVTAQAGKWSQLPLQPADFGFDEYLRFKGSGTYWNTQERGKEYTLNGKQVTLRDKEYLPEVMHHFVVDFMTRHKDRPFYLYYSMSHIHSDILRTPDSAPESKDLFKDNIVYMDKLVGKLVAELEQLKLRENTLILFAGDNGLVSGETPRSTVNGKVLCGFKGNMQEGGSLEPFIANWPGVTPAGKVLTDLVDFSDFYPTIAEAAGAKLPAGVTLDGRSIVPQLRGQPGKTRETIFVELGRHWFVREMNWKLNEAGELFDMTGAPFTETLVATNTANAAAIAARKRLQAELDRLNPAGGILDPGDGSGRHAKNVRKEKNAQNKAPVDPEVKAKRKAARKAAQDATKAQP